MKYILSTEKEGEEFKTFYTSFEIAVRDYYYFKDRDFYCLLYKQLSHGVDYLIISEKSALEAGRNPIEVAIAVSENRYIPMSNRESYFTLHHGKLVSVKQEYYFIISQYQDGYLDYFVNHPIKSIDIIRF